MEKEEQEQRNHHVPNTIALSQSEQVDYDHNLAQAVALQYQEEDVTMLETSESEEDLESNYSSSTDSDHPNFFTSQELAEFELLEQEEEEELEEDDIIDEDEEEDELTYEDLVALGEVAGHENQGLSPEEIPSTLSSFICKSIQSNTGIDRCVICQDEYEEGEELVNLRCDHPFHEACIKHWLQIKKTCPICSKEVIKQKTE